MSLGTNATSAHARITAARAEHATLPRFPYVRRVWRWRHGRVRYVRTYIHTTHTCRNTTVDRWEPAASTTPHAFPPRFSYESMVPCTTQLRRLFIPPVLRVPLLTATARCSRFGLATPPQPLHVMPTVLEPAVSVHTIGCFPFLSPRLSRLSLGSNPSPGGPAPHCAGMPRLAVPVPAPTISAPLASSGLGACVARIIQLV